MSLSIFLLKGDFRVRVEEWLRAMRTVGIRFRVTSTRRSFAEQKILWERWLAGKSTIPAAPPGKSRHQLGLAIDVVFHDPGGLEASVRSAKIHLIRWAGPGDAVHFDSPRELPCPPC